MSGFSRADLALAAKDLNRVLDLDPQIDVAQKGAALRDQVLEAAKLLKDGDAIDDATIAVLKHLQNEVPASSEVVTVAKPATVTKPAKVAKAPKTVKLGKFEPVRRTSQFGLMLEAYFAGTADLAALASAAGIDHDKALAVLKRARIAHGIDHTLSEGDGALTIVLPENVDANSVWRQSKEKPVKAKGEHALVKRRYADDAVITLLVKNPKREGSAAYDRYNFYRDGMTVVQFLEAGGSRADLSWDSQRKYIEIGGSV